MAEQIELPLDHEAWALLYTTFRSRRLLGGQTREEYWAERGAYSHVVRLPPGSTCRDAIEAARHDGVFGVGTTTSGVFEIHSNAGVYWHEKGIRNLGLCKPEQVRFTTWEELETDPDAADNPFNVAVSQRLEHRCRSPR